jgi:uncharacterized cupredoxin-like copper-binding protein
MKNRVLVAVLAALAPVAAACGGDDDSDASGDGTNADRTIELDMSDTEFDPESIEVNQGETVRFVFTNTGKVDHDAFIGDKDAQADHEAEMRAAEEEEHGGGHGEEAEDAVTVEPDEAGELTYTFDESGSLEIGCHQPGHYADGMKVDVTVT